MAMCIPKHYAKWAAVCIVVLAAQEHVMGGAAIMVADFGAVPDDNKSDTAAIRKAIDALAGKADVRLVFAKGRYDLHGKRGPYLRLKGVRGLTIEGGGAELVGHEIAGFFSFDNCREVTIRNLTIDMDPLPFSTGEVVEAGKGYFDLAVSAPHRARAGLRVEGVLGYDPKARRLARRGIDLYQMGFAKTTQLLRPGVMRVFVQGTPPVKGRTVIVRHQIYGYNAFTFSTCDGIKLENVTVHAAAGMGLYARDSRNLTLKGFNVMIRPKSGRWMSTTADATHFNTCRGTIILEDCLFEGMGDDATNLHSMYMSVARRVDDRRLGLSTRSRRRKQMPRNRPRPGDLLEIAAGATPFTPYATLTVEVVEMLDQPLKDIVVKFAGALPEKAAKGHVVANVTACPKVRIRRCTVRNNRARGMLIQTRDVVVEDCKFEYCSGAALHITCDTNYWWEAIAARKVQIRNNSFLGCGFGTARRGATIDVFAEVGSKAGPPGVHRNITIEGNTITGADGSAVHIGSADGVMLRNNTIVRPTGVAVTVDHSRNVTVTGNKLTGGAGGLKVGSGCDAATIKSSNNKGF